MSKNSAPVLDDEAEPFLTLPDAGGDVESQISDYQNVFPLRDRFRENRADGRWPDHSQDDGDIDESILLGVRGGKSPILPRFLRSLRRGFRTRSRFDKDRGRNQREGARIGSVVLRIARIIIMFFGIIQIVTMLLGIITAFAPEKLDFAVRTWYQQEQLDELFRWPTDYTAGILPAACHSHNDYWRKIPLHSALEAGCVGVEADVWLHDDDLLVGHSESALKADRTLTTLYINPLVEILNRQNPITEFMNSTSTPHNGVFDTNAAQTLVLLIDFKTSGPELFPIVSAQLAPLRERQYLTYFNGHTVIEGPVTVVVTGNAPFDKVVANMTYRDMFFDAPLAPLSALAYTAPSLAYNSLPEREYLSTIRNITSTPTEDQNQGQGHSGLSPTDPAVFQLANSYYASVDFSAVIGWPRPYLSQAQKDKIATQIEGAHAHGLKVRYWGVPNWPIGMRNYLWRELSKMGVDFLNADDIQSATKGDWKSGHSIWDWSLWGGRDW